jgi:hypothetical protein
VPYQSAPPQAAPAKGATPHAQSQGK